MNQEYRLYLTYRSEYLVLRDLCVGVRDRRSCEWVALHAATCSHVLGPIDSVTTTPLVAGRARVGEHLCLYSAARRIVTSPIIAVEQPSSSLLRDAERHWHDSFEPSDPRHSRMLLAVKER